METGFWRRTGAASVAALALASLSVIAISAAAAKAEDGERALRPAFAAGPATAAPYWLAPMRKLHAGYKGTAGYVAQLGDSITFSKAFWSPLEHADPSIFLKNDGLPRNPNGRQWADVIRGTQDKGPEHGNCGSWSVRDIGRVIDQVLATHKPEVAIIMIGTNDFAGRRFPDYYQADLVKLVQKCTDARCIPILNTIPPMRGRIDKCETANRLIRDLAEKMKVPLVDYYGEILKRQPKTWDGTLISGDGVHPSGGKVGEFSEENLNTCGYALRTWVNFLMFREIYFRILAPAEN
jgi:lysophospholipase L1-like esterase